MHNAQDSGLNSRLNEKFASHTSATLSWRQQRPMLSELRAFKTVLKANGQVLVNTTITTRT